MYKFYLFLFLFSSLRYSFCYVKSSGLFSLWRPSLDDIVDANIALLREHII